MTEPITTKSVHQAWADVMASVQGIAKRERNNQQNFNFRGIDAVTNAIGPALRDHGVMVIPTALTLDTERYETAKGAIMQLVTVQMQYTIYGPAGDSIIGTSYGAAADAGDKAVPKAQSVAYRTFLLQATCMPTDEPDPDLSVHERVAPRTEWDAAKFELLDAVKAAGLEPTAATAEFAKRGHGELRDSKDVPAIRDLIEHFKTLKKGAGSTAAA